nr:YbjN domain-containing protein [Deltaproteobacteria bacterium]
ELGHPVPASRITDPTALHAWKIPKGSAVTRVTLINSAEFTHLRVAAVVMTLDAKVDRPSLFAHLLALNTTLCGAAFGCDADQILLMNERTTLDLDRSEVLDTIRRVTTCADEHDDVLVARFGGAIGVSAAAT